MKLKRLTEAQMLDIYQTYMTIDFPLDELKPFELISKLVNKNIYFAFGLFEEDKLFAYAFLTKSSDRRYLLLDYFAVCSDVRGKGIGSLCLSLLKDECKAYDGIFIEVENVEYAGNEVEKAVRSRRIAFYERNGAEFTDILCRLFGVEMNIMIFDLRELQQIQDESVQNMMQMQNESKRNMMQMQNESMQNIRQTQNKLMLYDKLNDIYITMLGEKLCNEKITLSYLEK